MSPARGSTYDCIVVGGGHNGLVCATYLARGGRSVLLLEAAEQLGGAAVTREFAPGFSVSACAHLLHLMPPALRRELDLARILDANEVRAQPDACVSRRRRKRPTGGRRETQRGERDARAQTEGARGSAPGAP